MKFNKNKLFLSGAILGLFGAGFVYGSSQISDARAETLTMSGGSYTVYWNPNGYNFDTSGPFTFNGGNLNDIRSWVWCIERTIPTNNGYQYSGEDILSANFDVRVSSSGSTLDIDQRYSVSTVQKKVMATLGYVLFQMSESDLKILFKDDLNEVEQIKALRNLDDVSTKFTYAQILYWQIADETVSSKTVASFNVSYLQNHIGVLNNLYDLAGKLEAKINSGDLVYNSGARIWTSGSAQRIVTGAAGSVTVKPKTGYLKVTKEFSNLTQDLNTKPSWNPDGIKVGVYKNPDASGQPITVLTIGGNGQSNTFEVEPGTYYGFELDVNGNPIKSVASEVVDGTAANRGYVSGSDKKDTRKPYVTWNVTDGNTSTNPDVETFVNTPEVVNFTFSKEIAADSIKPLEAIDPQYTRVGAVYTLYKDAGATEPVTRNGQNVTATIGADGTAEFSNLYRGVYYVKETAVPTVVKNGRTVKRFALDPKVYKVDLSTMNDNETVTGDSTEITTKEFKQVGSFVSFEPTGGRNNGSLVIKKKDADTKSNTAQGQATLQGAEFKVEFYEMTTLGTDAPVKKWETIYKTDAKGEIDVRNRNLMVSTTNADAMNKLFTAYEQAKEWGAYDYRVTEVKAPNGYKLGDEPQTKDFVVKSPENYEANNFTWQYDDASIYNNDLEIELIKTQRPSGDWLTVEDAKKVVIKNATFELTNTDTNDKFTATTDDNGKLKYNGIIAGNYTLREVSADKYITNGQIINLTVAQQDGTTKLVASSQSVPTEENGAFNVTEMVTDKDILVEFENTAAPAKVKLVKANEKGAKLDGAKFKFVHYSADGLTKLGETELTTNANGELNLEELVIGDWYTVEETKAPQGYKLPAERSVLRFRAEAIPAKDSYAISYWTSTVNKTSESNQEAVTSTIKKISTEDTVQDGIKFDADEAKGTMAIEFDFVNNTWKQLPATGSNFGLIAGVAVVAIVIGSAVFYVKKREA